MRVTNATQRDIVPETVGPLLASIRRALGLQFDRASERLHCLEQQMPCKVNKEFVDAFFREIRLAVQETGEKVAALQAALADRAMHDEVDEKIEEVRRLALP
jgi:hypothetical protein